MSKSIMRFGLVLLFLVSLPLLCVAQPISKTVAVVNGTELTEAELRQEINILMPMNQAFHGKVTEEKSKKINAEAMKNLVDAELKAQDAEAKGMKIDPAAFDEEFNKMVTKFKTKEDLAVAYQNAGFTEKSFKRVIERKLLAEKNRLAEVDGSVSVTPEKIKNYYTANISRYSRPEEFRASHILIKVDPSSTKEEKAARKARAELLLKRIKAGDKFEEIAAEESDDSSSVKGGDLGFFHASQTVPEFEEALLKLKIGETSGIVETLYGFHIIRLTEKRAPRLVPFDEIKDKLQKDLVSSEKAQLLESWMDRLYKKAKISYPGVK
jgi:parvulin-like peptidyl-prolyl isomerase